MGAINLPFNIVNDDPLDASQVMADLQAITQVANGGLEASANVSTASAVTQPGSTNSEGVAATLARSDHGHLLQGFENLAADPPTGNFKGRVYWNTATSELRYCSDASGGGTFLALTPSAAELIIHAAQHKDGGHDPLADNTVTDHMKAAGTIYTATLASTVSPISTSAYTTIVDLTSLTTTGVQNVLVTVTVKPTNTTLGNNPRVNFRVIDVTNANTTIWTSGSHQLGVSTGAATSALCYSFVYSTPAGGARTLRLQAGCDMAAVDITKPNPFNTEAVIPPTITAVIL